MVQTSCRACAALALALLACTVACVRTQSSTYRWGGRAHMGSFLVDMGTLHRAGSRVDFDVLFVPNATAQKPELGKVYTRNGEWIDCASGLQAQKSSQPYANAGLGVGAKDGPDASPSPIEPGTTWASVQALLCTGRNDLDDPPLTGTDAQVVAKARALLAARAASEPASGPAAGL